MLTSTVKRLRRSAARVETAVQASLERDARQVLIMAGAVTSIGLVLLTGIAALVRSEPAAKPEAAAKTVAEPAAAPRLAVALSPKRRPGNERSRRAQVAEQQRSEREPLRGRARSAEPEAAADAVAIAPPNVTLAPPPAIPTLESAEAEPPKLEDAPFLRGAAEPAADTTPPTVKAEAPAPVFKVQRPPEAAAEPRSLANRLISPIRRLRPRVGASKSAEAAAPAAIGADAAAEASGGTAATP